MYLLKKYIVCLLLLTCTLPLSCQNIREIEENDKGPSDIKTGAEQTGLYFPLLAGKTIAVVANQTSLIGKVHLVDSLLSAGMLVKKVFCPEHGFRGQAGAGEVVSSAIDSATGLPVVSLYGKNKKPLPADLKDVDIVIFDIQDVGARFYTYISTMHYVMEACAENGKLLIVLDRPNPNGHYVDGPLLSPGNASFVGMHPVPIVHGMTIGEYAGMINGEKWLKNGIQCRLTVIPVSSYSHTDFYSLPVKPSPNLPTMEAVYLYPSLCLFEGTCVSVGRGTGFPFEVIGHPAFDSTGFSFTPQNIRGVAMNPPCLNEVCNGYRFTSYTRDVLKYDGKLYLFPLLESYRLLNGKCTFFNKTFRLLAGNDELQKQIESGATEEDIHKSWQPGLESFKKIRKKYLLYKDFE